MRIAMHARVAAKDAGQDVTNQLRELRQFIERKADADWTLVAEDVDEASGKTGDRVQLKIMFADAAERKFDLYLFRSLDRFGREGVLETLQYLQRLTNNGIAWWISLDRHHCQPRFGAGRSHCEKPMVLDQRL
jgi:DNA invertase Pin-like site-specific DNA recombinase